MLITLIYNSKFGSFNNIKYSHENDSIFSLFGYASGTYKNLKNKENSNFWRIPAAWRAIVKDDKIKLWQVYADNMIVMDIIKRNQ